jgi:hypothetical protein
VKIIIFHDSAMTLQGDTPGDLLDGQIEKMEVEFHDQGDAKWIVISRQIWGHKS